MRRIRVPQGAEESPVTVNSSLCVTEEQRDKAHHQGSLQADTRRSGIVQASHQISREPATVDAKDLEQDDIVIAVMGPTGSGKSTFVYVASGHDIQGIGHGLTSYTTDVLAVRFQDEESGRRIVLVDTPGFNDTHKSDVDILNMISSWLNASYQRGKLLSGILYLHRISDNRMAGTPLRNLRLLQKLCGDDALRKVYLTTTMWDEVEQSVGQARLQQLITEYWLPMISQGAQHVRSQRDGDSARRIIQRIISQHATRRPMQLQREMTDLQKKLEETQAGQELYGQLRQFVQRHGPVLKRIGKGKTALSEVNEPEVLGDTDALRMRIDDASRQMQQLRPSWLEKVRHLFSHRHQASTARHQNTQDPLQIGTEQPQRLPRASGEPPQTDTGHTETTLGSEVWEGPSTITNTKKLERDDIVIAVMGPTGSGKSTFVCHASGHDIQGIGHDLKSCTTDVLAIRFRDRESGRHVVLVDTPGFDDTYKSDVDILNRISEWLNSSYKQQKLLSGILYLHRITDNRMAGTPLKNLRVFEKLCGKDALDKVYLVTTMWDEMEQSAGEQRLEELETQYWRSIITQGAQVTRCRNDDDSAKEIVRRIVGGAVAGKAVLLQKEMTDLQKLLKETQAGQELYSQLEQLVTKQMELLQKIDKEKKVTSEANVLEDLQREYSTLQMQIDGMLPQIQELRLSWLERFFRLFLRS